MKAGLPVAIGTILWILACGEDERPQSFAPQGSGGAKGGSSGAGRATTAGSSGDAGAGGSNASAGGGGVEEGGSAGLDGLSGGSGGEEDGIPSAGAAGEPQAVVCPSDSAEDDPEPVLWTCDPSANWGDPSRVDLGSTSLYFGQRLIGITPDELSVVWSAPGADLEFLVSDRAASDQAFVARVVDGDEPVLLGADGLSVAVISETRDSLFERRRTARGEPFGEPSAGPFTELNATAMAEGLTFGGLAVTPDDRTLYYSVFAPEPDSHAVRVTTRSSTELSWPEGRALTDCEFEAPVYLAPTPTAVSSDGLTLFYDDGVRTRARQAYRETREGPFVHFSDLPDFSRVQPNLACDRLYYSYPGRGGVFSVSRLP